jgi:hypothetical protein
VRLEATAPRIKRAPPNVVPEMRYAFFAHAHKNCAPRNESLRTLPSCVIAAQHLIVAPRYNAGDQWC